MFYRMDFLNLARKREPDYWKAKLNVLLSEIFKTLDVVYPYNINYIVTNTRELEVIFEAIDKVYLDNFFKTNFSGKFCFNISNRMTKVAARISSKKPYCQFDITFGLNTFKNFGLHNASEIVNGNLCDTHLEAIISVMQHELLHAIQCLVSGNSKHNAEFKFLGEVLFGHKGTTHAIGHKLIEPSSVTAKPGNIVSFTHKGEVLTGTILRISKRATVVTPTDRKFYVPITQLKVI